METTGKALPGSAPSPRPRDLRNVPSSPLTLDLRVDSKTLEDVLTQIGQQLVRGGLPQTIEVGPAGWQAFSAPSQGASVGVQGLRNFVQAGACRLGVCGPDPARVGDLASYLDHTLLKADATANDIDALCAEALAHRFASVCIQPTWVRRAAEILGESSVLVCTVVGFPLGANVPEVKAYEARRAIEEGACEVDMVLNVGALKSGDDRFVQEDIEAVATITHQLGARLKVILETCLLTPDEITRASRLAKAAGADFVKTSTGFGGGGATAQDVALMRQAVGPVMGVKASGGVRDQATAQAMIEAGATRIGASASVEIVRGQAASSRGY